MPNRKLRYETKTKGRTNVLLDYKTQYPSFFEPKGFYTTSFENFINIKGYYAKICMKLLSNKSLREIHDTLPEHVELPELPVEKYRQYRSDCLSLTALFAAL